MSYTIEYQAACFILPSGWRGLARTKFVIATERGCNNLTERTRGGQERRVREWGIAMLGSPDDVMRQVVGAASYCEGGGLRLAGRRAKPEAYIGRMRRLLSRPRDDAQQHLSLHATVKVDHPLVARGKAFGLPTQFQTTWGADEAVLSPPRQVDGEPDWGLFLRAIEPFLQDGSVAPCRLGAVWGLQAS